MKNLVYLLVICLSLTACENKTHESISTAETLVFKNLNQVLTDARKEQLRIVDKELTGQDYHAVRQYVKAQLLTNDSLKNIFETNGIGDMDVLPRALANCYEDYLQDSTFNLKEEYSTILTRWIPIRDCRKFHLDRAKADYARFSIGDSLSLKSPYYSSSTGYAIDIVEAFCSGKPWEFNTDEDELYHGILLEKTISRDSKSYLFRLKVYHMNDNQNRRNGNSIKLGEDILFTISSPVLVEALHELE